MSCRPIVIDEHIVTTNVMMLPTPLSIGVVRTHSLAAKNVADTSGQVLHIRGYNKDMTTNITAKQEADMIAAVTNYAEIVMEAGGMSPAAWRRAHRLCRLLNVTFDDVMLDVMEAR